MLSRHVKNFISSFPEALYPCKRDMLPDYNVRVIEGYKKMSRSTVVICGLARDLGSILNYTIARIERLGSMFKSYQVIIYENDSTDGTDGHLLNWSFKNKRVSVISEKLKKIRHKQDTSTVRTIDMAYYRNKYLRLIKCIDSDYVIVIDSDLEGGWSYEGIANSFSYDFDVIGSNSLYYREFEGKLQRIYFDAWAFRKLNHPEPHEHEDINILTYNRGEQPVKVFSCFGGLAVYRRDVLIGDIYYRSGDCDHPTLHECIRNNGYDKIYINPSQITLYSPTGYMI